MPCLESVTVVGVVGAGAMGAGIAQVAAAAGHRVKLFDTRPGAALQALAGIDRQLTRLVEKGRLAQAEHEAICGRLQPAETLDALSEAGLVIEAIIERVEVKQRLFQQLESLCTEGCIFASNTSSLSITQLAAGLRRPERLAGMHFFNPAPLMALVEIVSGLATDASVADTLYATAQAWGKQPVQARSTPGFIVNRVARPFYAESLRLLQEGAADAATLDALLRDAGGFRMGAFELTDLIGHDVNYAVTCSVFEAYYGDARYQPSLVQKALVDAGRLGRKTGKGFYDYAEGAERPLAAELDITAATLSLNALMCRAEGDLGPLQPLVMRLGRAGVRVSEHPGDGVLRIGDATLALSDGRMACQRARDTGTQNLVLIDLALDYAHASRVAISWAADTTAEARGHVVEALRKAGLRVSGIADLPGLVVLRTVAMLANEAADAVLQGVASAEDIDLAMRAGVNYPLGPLAWADRLGVPYTLNVLENLQASYGESRYRPSLLLRRRAAEGAPLHD